MRARIPFAALFLVPLLAITAPVSAAGIPVPSVIPGENLPSLAPIIRKVGASVVSIAVKTTPAPQGSMTEDSLLRQLFGLPDLPGGMNEQQAGSGVVFDSRLGLIVTNYHVVENADRIVVTLSDGRETMGVLQGSDPDTDVALIKVPLNNLPSLVFGDSDRLEVGDYVLAIGNPFGIGQTVTSGIVSGLRRTEMGLERYEDFIQTDASINPGNSGGALVNLRGDVVGINAAIVGGGHTGIGFAIPINMVRAIADQLVRYGSVERGELGFAVARVVPEFIKKYRLPAGQPGAVVTRIEAKSSAGRAGLMLGDLVTALGASKIRDAADLRNKLGLLRVGDLADMTVWRNGQTLHIQAAVEDIAAQRIDGALMSPLFEGAEFVTGPSNSADTGLQVSGVRRDSNAWKSGMREGDVILSVNRKRVADQERFAEEAAKTPDRLVLGVLRMGEVIDLSIRIWTNRPGVPGQ